MQKSMAQAGSHSGRVSRPLGVCAVRQVGGEWGAARFRVLILLPSRECYPMRKQFACLCLLEGDSVRRFTYLGSLRFVILPSCRTAENARLSSGLVGREVGPLSSSPEAPSRFGGFGGRGPITDHAGRHSRARLSCGLMRGWLGLSVVLVEVRVVTGGAVTFDIRSGNGYVGISIAPHKVKMLRSSSEPPCYLPAG